MTPEPAAAAQASAAPWQQFICHACGYIYDEAEGDPDSGLAAGTRFADIPDDWACPLCGVTKADFSPHVPPDLATLQRAAPGLGNAPARAGVVVVGAGKAGWQVVEQLRAQAPDTPITLVTACAGDVYEKPMLSVAMGRGLDNAALVQRSGAEAAAHWRVRLLAHTRALHICTRSKTLRTTHGPVPYTQLVLAHGAQAALPPPLHPALCWRINHLQAYQRFVAALGGQPRHVAIVGAGLVGCELANDLALAGHRISLIDLQDRPMGRWPADQAGAPLLAAWSGLPIEFIGAVRLQDLQRSGPQYRLLLDNGQALLADQVVAATGLVTPSALAASAGLAWNNGIAVDPQTMQTSVVGIYALGDCISVHGQASRFIEPIVRQARTLSAALVRARSARQEGPLPPPYEARAAVVRVKTRSLALTLQAAPAPGA